MPNPKVGDRVRVIEITDGDPCKIGDIGTVLEENHSPYVEFDRNIGGHDCDRQCKDGHGWAVAGWQIELVKEGQ